jgi:hypothetical protein
VYHRSLASSAFIKAQLNPVSYRDAGPGRQYVGSVQEWRVDSVAN